MQHYKDDPNDPREMDIIKEMMGKLDREANQNQKDSKHAESNDPGVIKDMATAIESNECPICL